MVKKKKAFHLKAYSLLPILLCVLIVLHNHHYYYIMKHIRTEVGPLDCRSPGFEVGGSEDKEMITTNSVFR